MFQCQTWSRSRRAGVGNWFPVGGRDAACVFALVRPRPRSAAVGCFAPKFPCPSSSRLFGESALNGARWGCNRDPSGQLLAMQMGRHWRAAGVQFAVKVGELPASIFQEEPAPQREQSAGKVHKEHGNHDQDRRFVLVNQQEAIGNEEGDQHASDLFADPACLDARRAKYSESSRTPPPSSSLTVLRRTHSKPSARSAPTQSAQPTL